MKVLKRDVMLLVTLIFLLLTLSMAREDPFPSGVDREDHTGTDVKQNKAQHALPLFPFRIMITIPTGPNPLHNMRASPPKSS